MEHKLIQGGEQYLPFARSRIKALRATGLDHAKQTFDMDDARVEVRISLDQDYITISGGPCTLAMDSGVVDVRNIAEANPSTFLPGVMHETSAGAAYNAPFVLPQGGGDWLLNPSNNSSTQLAGIIKGDKAGKFRGKLPADKSAASFSPRPVISNSTVPATWVASKHDEALWLKKITAILCPASIFTGKTRLYVQALYGRHLYTRKGENVSADPINIGLVYGSPPYITVPSYRAQGDAAEYNDVPIFTSTGVYLDKSTGKHWLMSLSGTGMTVHPLVGDACAESMRKFLMVPYPKNLPALGEEALERLEAYILSRCLPDQKNAQHAACALGMSFYSMGYSWHWNWSGTAADIVVNEQFLQYPDDPNPVRNSLAAMKSSHYRVTASKQDNLSEDGKPLPPTWSATLSPLEVNKKWYINRTFWVIAEPNISSGTFFKTTPRHSELFAGDGPFYAFYTGDALQLCRVAFIINPVSPPTHEESPDLYHGGIAGSIGPRAGFSRDKNFGSEFYTCVITCGSQGSGRLLWGHFASESNTEYSKTLLDTKTGPRWSYDEGYYAQAYSSGYPPYQLSGVFPSAIINTSYLPTGNNDIETSNIRHEWLSVATVVVPQFDSEAVYLQAAQAQTTTTSGNITHWSSSEFGGTTQVNVLLPSGQFAPPIYFTRYGWVPFGPFNGLSAGPDTPIYTVKVSQEIAVKVLVCKAGVVELDNFDGIGELHDPEADEASGSFTVNSGASTRNPVVIASKLKQPIGVPSIGYASVIVGYA